MMTFNEFPMADSAAFEAAAVQALKGKPLDSLDWAPFSGVVQPAWVGADQVSNHPLSIMRNNSDWGILSFIRVKDLPEANKRMLRELSIGANGLVLEIDRTLTASEWNLLLNGVSLRDIAVHVRTATDIGSVMKELSQSVGLSNGSVVSEIQDDEQGLAILADCPDGFRSMVLEESHGVNPDLAIAELLSGGVVFLDKAISHGLRIDQAVAALQFNFHIEKEYFVQIAKLRAFRKLWTGILNNYQVDLSGSDAVHIVAMIESEANDNAARDNGFIGNTARTMAALIGGVDELCIRGMDEEFTSGVHAGIQLLCRHEAFLGVVSDPAAGSYYIERLTESLARSAWDRFKVI